jgi:CRP-like cAMP-binding protein
MARSTSRNSQNGKLIQNEILAAMNDSEFRTIRSHLEYVNLPSHVSLCEPDQPFKFAYFPNAGMISIVVVLSDGKTVEAGLIGKEGIVGLAGVAGRKRSQLREVVQISGEGFRIAMGALRDLLESAPALDGNLKRYASAFGMQVAQTAACNRLHATDRRLARWLLMAMDRVDTGLLHITHDFLGTMLGTDRSSVSLAAGDFQKRGIIKYSRGTVKILDRKLLETSACECYRVIQNSIESGAWI